MSTKHNDRHNRSVTTGRSTDLDEDDLYEALSNSRRRHVIRAVDQGDCDVGELAEQIAAAENDCSPAALDTQQRKRVYIGLYQCHLGVLDNVDIIDWDDRAQTVKAGATHKIALEAMGAVSEPLDEPDTMLDRVRNYLGVSN